MSDTTLPAGPDARILANTSWSEIPSETLDRALRGARERQVGRGGLIFATGDSEPRAGILLAGTARAFLEAVDGRRLTVRYARRGAFLGRRARLLGGHGPIAVEAVTDVTLLELDARSFLRLVDTEVTVARAVLAELGRQLEDVYATAADATLGTLRARVARHLLALVESGASARPIAPITPSTLAAAVGTSQGDVGAVLAQLGREGSIELTASGIRLLDSARLAVTLGAWQAVEPEPEPDRDDSLIETEAILEASPSAVVAVKPGGEIRYVNAFAEATFGWPRADLVGRSIETLIPEHLRPEHVSHRARFLDDPIPRPVFLRPNLRARRRDGSDFPVAVGLSTVAMREGMLVLATVVDLSAA